MIFVTVGTQLAFDRLVKNIDEWARYSEQDVFAQIGPSEYIPKYIKHVRFLPPHEADELFSRAEIIVSHAGMGSVLTALKLKKPILIMPRKADLGEHRNNHQMATAKWLESVNGVTVAYDELSLLQELDKDVKEPLKLGISDYASDELIDNLKRFFDSTK